MALGMLVEGKWVNQWQEHDDRGNFQRMVTQFRGNVEPVIESDKFRYTVYASYGCPWAQRVIMALDLLGLNEFIQLAIVEPQIGADGWFFSDKFQEKNYNLKFLRELYVKMDPRYTGRVTVPVLWDGKNEKIVCNESLEILKILDKEFRGVSKNSSTRFFLKNLNNEITAAIEYNYEAINNGCYRTGFARSQDVYEFEVKKLFAELESLDRNLEGKNFLVGDQLTAADVSLLPTLLRFDIAYYSLFKCNIKQLRDFSNLERYRLTLLENPLIRSSFKVDHIKTLYYKIPDLNPTLIVPVGPE